MIIHSFFCLHLFHVPCHALAFKVFSLVHFLLFTMDDIIRFYKSAAWLHVRQEQLEADHYECQRCKHMGKYKDVKTPRRYTKATLVHHEFRVRQFPQYKLMRFVGGVRNMYSLCNECHEIEHHGERGFVKKEKDLNEEKW